MRPFLNLVWNNRVVRRVGIIFVHLSLWTLAFMLALVLRFDGQVPKSYADAAPYALVALLVCRLSIFYFLGLFHGLWRYAGMPELKSLVWATTIGTGGFIGVGAMWHTAQMPPRSIYVGEWLASIVLVGGFRFLIRIFRERRLGELRPNGIRTLIVGAGDAGESLLRDVQRMPDSKWTICGFLDDDPVKAGALVRNVRVLGRADEMTLRRVIEAHEIKLVILAITTNGKRTREIVSICRRLGVQAKTIPSLPDRIGNELAFSQLKEIDIDDLLRRDPVELDVAQVESFIEGRTLLISGGGGSIGSELARQSLRFKPRSLLLLDHDENALFFIERELREKFPSAEIHPIIGDITDPSRVDWVFQKHRPAVVLHAAAHKHVPMMEANPCEAVKNNVFGTIALADAAHRYGADAFVLISTDKAVNPTSVMGATKRVAEIALQGRAEKSSTRYAAVRFGNVLGSAGSVVPLFRDQIARGGPVQVTHPDVCRYFMTIPEATQLVLQAGALGGTGEIFVLDMGQPIKIVSLARDLIELSGLRVDEDIQIEFTGLRPGEKLFEELMLDGEAYNKTPHPKILVGKVKRQAVESLASRLDALRVEAVVGDEMATRRILSALVPEGRLARAGESSHGEAASEPRSSVVPVVATA